jgi:tRNA pseudouridine13 synthase
MHGGEDGVRAWVQAALQPPRAHGPPLPPVQFKATPEDFHVEEQLSFTPSGDGPHWLLRVQKRMANTRWVAAEIARLGEVAAGDVGYAGLKDRQAVAVQWFSVPARSLGAEFWREVCTPEFRVLDVHANQRKLRRGALSGNRFRIRLRNVAWSNEQLEAKLGALRAHGVPNYFGPQRFGREGCNLDRLAAWVRSGVAPRGRTDRGFALSAGRSLIFNAVLARRVAAGNWARLVPGDVANLDGSASHFAIEHLDGELERRLAAFDIHPSGPLWGRGDPPSHGRTLQDELAVSLDFAAVAGLLAAEGMSQERRALRCAILDVSSERDADEVTLCFGLRRGQFATSVLREICELDGVARLDADDD